MYKQVKTKEKITLENGGKATPVATLADEYGGVAHIWIDDNCYVFGLEREVSNIVHTEYHNFYKDGTKTVVKKSNYVFNELHDVLKSLPSPSFYKNPDIEKIGNKILYRLISRGLEGIEYSDLKEGTIRNQIINENGDFIKIDNDWYNKKDIRIEARNIF